ncbi:hypothetical protein [Streptomyces stelliscabiei]|uniref:hypothetical protein n=1 Tax=Streptomyces stelliscabiei TaxID=146820 RepID=UPI0029A61D47|nr:hypothetical protein [Streptomyces stelliscabiei]MDX3435648.1 hypothetical protein [Streptomyces stelliscabiei]MDX3622053.1 hypothetical protein [Streptomyces stelliscabiei]
MLEHRYAAVLLASLLTGDPLEELGDPVLVPVEIKLQASRFSKVDDILITARPRQGGEDFQVAIGVRRDPDVVPSSDATVALVGSYLREVTERWGAIQMGRYRLALAVTDRNAHGHEVARLAGIASGVGEPEAFRAEASRSGPTDSKMRARLDQLDRVVAKAVSCGIETHGVSTRELTWRLLSTLRVHHLRLEDGDERDYTQAVSSLRSEAVENTAGAAEQVLSRIEHLVGGWAPTGAQVTEAMLRRDLAARLKPRFSSVGAEVQPVEVAPDALIRGPVAHLGLAPDLEEAQRLEAGHPAAAARLYARIADALETSVWAPLALSLRQRQAKAHHDAGDHAEGVAADVSVLAAALPMGEVWRAMSVVRRLVNDQIEAPDEFIRAANALGGLAAFEYHHDVSLDDITASIDALQISDPHCLMAVTWFAEHAVASDRPDLLRSRVERLTGLASSAEQRDQTWQARLLACLADTDRSGAMWITLARSARSEYPPPVTALLLARHARHLADAGQAQDALDRYDDAVERAVQRRNHDDAAAWTEAHNLVRIRYGLQTARVSDAYPTATALRAADGGSVLPEPFSARERALGRVANHARTAETLQALTQYLRQAVVTASWLEEHEAHELLGRFHLDHGEINAAVNHLVAAGSHELLNTLDVQLPEEPFHFPVPDGWAAHPRWRRHSALTAVRATADLLPDEQAWAWVDVALAEIADDQEVPFGTRNVRRAAFSAFASLADAADTPQAQRFLDLTGLVRTGPGRRHRGAEQDYAQALIRIAIRHPGLPRIEAVDRMCQVLLTDTFAANVILGRGEDALRLQPSVVSERCTAAAAGGNTEAAMVLLLANAPADSARPLAQKLLDRSLGRQTETDPSLDASPSQAAFLIGRLLPSADRESFADALTQRIRSHHHTAQQRQDALDALNILTAYLEPEHRARHLDVTLDAARGYLDGSAQDDLNATHAYDHFQLDMGTTTLRYHGLSAAAHMAQTLSDGEEIIGIALPLLAQPEGPAESLIVETLAQLPYRQNLLPLPLLAGHPSPWVRALAAHLWCTTDQTATTAHLGTHLAADTSPRVRCTLARELLDDEEHTDLREVLRSDCRRSVRTAAGQTSAPDRPRTRPPSQPHRGADGA